MKRLLLAQCKRTFTQEVVTSLSFTKQVQNSSLICDILPEKVWRCNMNWFSSFSKITSVTLCNPIHYIPNSSLSFALLNLESGKEAKKITKTHRFLQGWNASLFWGSRPLTGYPFFLKQIALSFWQSSKLVHVNCIKHFKMKMLHFVLH